MSDIRTFTRPVVADLPALDWLLKPPSLASDNGLESAVIISLFTDRRAEQDDELAEGDTDRRGWWADAWPSVPGDRIGSRLWLLEREKGEQTVVNRAREYGYEALQWLIERGIVSQVEVLAGWIDRGTQTVTESKTAQSVSGILGLAVTLHRPQSAPARYQFLDFWKRAA